MFSQGIRYFFINLFIPKMKSISIGIFYRPPGQGNFLEISTNDLNLLDIGRNEIYLLGDFNINLLQDNKYILKENLACKSKNLVTPLLRQYKEFCQTYSLKQLIREATRVTRNSSSLLDHVLCSSTKKVSASGTIDIGVSDHQLTFCTRKIFKMKSNCHQNVFTRCLKNYDPKKFKRSLQKTSFPNYHNFSDIDVAYTDFVVRLTSTIDSLAPLKETRIKTNSQEWFDGEIRDKMIFRDKLYQKFKKTRNQVDEDIYKSTKYDVEKFIQKKKRDYYHTKLEQNIGKPKELWKTLKTLGLPSKKTSVSKICLKKEDGISFDDATNVSIFNKFYSNLADNLVKNLPLPSGKFGISSVKAYYNNLMSPNKEFELNQTTEEIMESILESLNIDKAAGIDNIS